MRRTALACLAVILVCTLAARAQDAASPLQGRWVVVDAEHNGKPMQGLNGGVLTVTGNAFEIRTASGNMLKGTMEPDASRRPAWMDMIHADGVVWEAIYEVSGDRLRLNYVQKGGKDPRPTTFKTSPATEESLIVLQRQTK